MSMECNYCYNVAKSLLVEVTWIVASDSENLASIICSTCMIARYRKAVVNYSKPLLFKPHSRQSLQQQIKLSFCMAEFGVLYRGKGRGYNNKKKINCNYDCM